MWHFHTMHNGHPHSRSRMIALHLLGGLFHAVVLSLFFGLFIMLLWNNLMPDIIGAARIGYFQAVGLLLLARLLFGGRSLGFAGHMRHPRRHGPEAWREYDEWWRQVGEKYMCCRPEDPRNKDENTDEPQS